MNFHSLNPVKDERDKIIDALIEVVDSGAYLYGDNVTSFEKEFEEYIGAETNNAVSVGNGFDALQIALKYFKPKDGRRNMVLVPAFAPIPVWMAVTACGGEPVPVAVDAYTYNVDFYDLEAKIDKYEDRLWAIIIVHMFGLPFTDIGTIKRKTHVPIIEDCAHAFGAKVGENYVGTLGHVGAFSFYPTKPLGAFGDAGMLVTEDARAKNFFLNARHYGGRGGAYHEGINSRMDEFQAAILRIKLESYQNELNRRDSVAQFYRDKLEDIEQITLPKMFSFRDKRLRVWYQYVVDFGSNDLRHEIYNYLGVRGIPSALHYSHPPHEHPVYSGWEYKYGFDVAGLTRLADSVISLSLQSETAVKTVELIREFFKDRN